MPKLMLEYPLTMRAFQTIEYDNAGVRSRIVPRGREIPTDWVDAFEVTEGVFQKLEGKDTSHVPELSEKAEYTNTPLWEVVAVPTDDDHKIAMTHVGIPKPDQWIANHVLYSFFDGELSEVIWGRQHRGPE